MFIEQRSIWSDPGLQKDVRLFGAAKLAETRDDDEKYMNYTGAGIAQSV
jgi:hypothetical protein